MSSGCVSTLRPPLPGIGLEVMLNAVELIASDPSNPFAAVPRGELLVKMEMRTGVIKDY